ncbi:hypothetical protein MOO44_03070 [Nicoliella spurrieriana]|uniref:Uncharacterized protein n=1 Tax=Nicoliella spurrieriana TaxID=2925830 RepID=A0A976RSZ8_9LACO|nr:hypothetical protein [Nicoliella spurrieriana]UQS87159.1 hypothetical protein MOO44_03070 [Nicoliella spurrieriana]
MKMDVDEFIEQVTNEQYAATNFTMNRKALEADLQKALTPLVQFITEQINADQIAQARLIVDDADTVFKLETGVINLPFDNIKATSKIMAGDGVKPINVYMIVESPDVNRSKLRIDEAAAADDFVKQTPAMTTRFVEWTQDQLNKIDANFTAGEEEAAETK